MLDEKNSLFTGISDEECANVCGGFGFTFNSDGSVTLTTTKTDTFKLPNGTTQPFTVNGTVNISPTGLPGTGVSISPANTTPANIPSILNVTLK